MIRRVIPVLLGSVLGVTTLAYSGYAAKNDSKDYTSIGYIGSSTSSYVTVNDSRVISLKSKNKDLNLLNKTKKIAQNLNKLLYDKKLRADKIMPAIRNNKYVITLNSDVIMTVDKDLAKAQNTSESDLTLKLTNNLRVALGGKPLNYLSYRPTRSLNSYSSQNSQFGYASWYGPGFQGRHTSNGDVFDMNKYTAAHRTLPLGSSILVTNLDTGRSVMVKVNDRGPFADTHKRVIDLSYAAFKKIASISSGVARIKIDTLN